MYNHVVHTQKDETLIKDIPSSKDLYIISSKDLSMKYTSSCRAVAEISANRYELDP